MRILQLLILKCCTVVLLLADEHGVKWDHDVYTGRHFNSLLVNSTELDNNVDDNLVVTPGLLIIYDDSCAEQLKKQNMVAERLPPAQYLAFAKYNQKTCGERIWYELDDEDDLKDRYGYVECPDVMYLPKGGPLDMPVPRIQGETFTGWIWRAFLFQIEIKNDLLEPIIVEITGQGPEVNDLIIEPGVFKSTKAYIAYTIVIRQKETGKFLYGLGIDERNKPKIDIVVHEILINKFGDATEEEFLSTFRNKIDAKSNEVIDKRKKIATMFALGIKQPLLLPKFSDRGYNFTDIKEETFYFELEKYYTKNSKTNLLVDLEPQFNTNDAPVKLIKLEDTIREKVASAVQTKLEEFSGSKLTLSEVSGIYLLGHGTYIRPHVGNIDGHVISAMVILDNEDPNFQFEVIDYTSDRVEHPLQAGTMLLYEAASVVHYSGTSFKGIDKKAAILYVHFKPSSRWTWTKSAEHITDGYSLENIYQLETATTKKENIKKNMFNRWHEDIHDEL